MITIKTRRLDRVTLVRRYLSLKAEASFLAALGVANIHACNGYLKKIGKEHATVFTKSYDGKASSTGISFGFSSVQKRPAIAINFTPSLLAEDDWVDFFSLMDTMFDHGGKEVWESFKVSKLEIALDIKVPFSEVVCLAPQIKTVDISYLKRGTLYLGHEYGHRSYCIYDKRKQLAEKKKVDLDHDLTRIEVRHRNLGKTLGQIDGLANPFGRLIAIRKTALVLLRDSHPQDFEFRAFVKSILAGYPAQYAYLELDAYSRKRITKLLRKGALNLNGEEQHWQGWIIQQQSMLKIRFAGT